eukprot:403337647
MLVTSHKKQLSQSLLDNDKNIQLNQSEDKYEQSTKFLSKLLDYDDQSRYQTEYQKIKNGEMNIKVDVKRKTSSNLENPTSHTDSTNISSQNKSHKTSQDFDDNITENTEAIQIQQNEKNLDDLEQQQRQHNKITNKYSQVQNDCQPRYSQISSDLEELKETPSNMSQTLMNKIQNIYQNSFDENFQSCTTVQTQHEKLTQNKQTIALEVSGQAKMNKYVYVLIFLIIQYAFFMAYTYLIFPASSQSKN